MRIFFWGPFIHFGCYFLYPLVVSQALLDVNVNEFLSDDQCFTSATRQRKHTVAINYLSTYYQKKKKKQNLHNNGTNLISKIFRLIKQTSYTNTISKIYALKNTLLSS